MNRKVGKIGKKLRPARTAQGEPADTVFQINLMEIDE